VEHAIILIKYFVQIKYHANTHTVVTAEGKRQFERPRRRWEDVIKMNLKEIGWRGWSGLTWLRIGIVGGLL
jgi:hypothetical protein